MNTPESGPDAGKAPRREHPRPVRYAREVRLPLEVRKELLLTRAELERHDLLKAVHEVKGGARRLGSFANWLPRAVRPGSWMKVLGLAQDYPLLSAAVTLALPLLRRTPLLRWTWKASKLGVLAGAAYWGYKTWRQANSQAVATADTGGAKAPQDTGFRDPLVR
ncbi:hypothetical protein LMG31506_03823 [Cupriavidus yeoncheonensis]|uniref:DUF3318 domain-containing protein n=1 Tax=Cupriavidus yeoncheonensis TaxID=1462994 RepID=A0A916IWB0_9BURK|nr:DUF3318 domain-containing protein [Cupriavidus yeoncheonensis]CAG2148431.1 hypothetical protein LMG31506_03823 [Cupriavidus yeoncheonensis]